MRDELLKAKRQKNKLVTKNKILDDEIQLTKVESERLQSEKNESSTIIQNLEFELNKSRKETETVKNKSVTLKAELKEERNSLKCQYEYCGHE